MTMKTKKLPSRKQRGGAITELTEIQAKCLEPGIAGKDILAKSNTGSGKTLAFLIASISRILKHGSPDPFTSFPITILTPVTDLANQIAKVAEMFLSYHPPMTVDIVIGGTNESHDKKRLSSHDHRVDILVATPGRLKSLLNQSESIKHRLHGCQTFIIDEADKLTDPGFLRDTKHIHSIARNPHMQTLMFSATMDRHSIMATGLLKTDAEFIEVLSADKSIVNTKVIQNVIVCSASRFLDAVVSVVQDQMALQQGGSLEDYDLNSNTLRALNQWESPTMKGYRIMCFLPSNAYIDYFSKTFVHAVPDVSSFVLHGGLAQHKRSKMSEAFRKTDNCILFTSDASARGVDYPDVTCVIQVGFDSRSEYLQRVGRTGRAGKSGITFLIIAPEEVDAASQICDVVKNVYIDREISTHMCDQNNEEYRPIGINFPESMKRDAKHAYRGWLGSLASKWKRLKMHKADVISLAQNMSLAMGLGQQDDAHLRSKLHV